MPEKPVIDPKAVKEMEAIMRVAFLGRHLLSFVCTCVSKGADPKAYIETMEGQGSPKDYPVAALWRWMNAPTPENVKALSEATGFNIEKTAEKMATDTMTGVKHELETSNE